MCNCNKKCCGNYLPLRCCCKPRPPPYCPEVKKLPPKKPCQKPCCNPCQKPCCNPCQKPCCNPCQKPCCNPCQKPCCNPCQKPCCNPCQKPCCNPCQKPCKPKHCCPDLTRPLPLKRNEDTHENEKMEQDRQIQDLIKKIF